METKNVNGTTSTSSTTAATTNGEHNDDSRNNTAKKNRKKIVARRGRRARNSTAAGTTNTNNNPDSAVDAGNVNDAESYVVIVPTTSTNGGSTGDYTGIERKKTDNSGTDESGDDIPVDPASLGLNYVSPRKPSSPTNDKKKTTKKKRIRKKSKGTGTVTSDEDDAEIGDSTLGDIVPNDTTAVPSASRVTTNKTKKKPPNGKKGTTEKSITTAPVVDENNSRSNTASKNSNNNSTKGIVPLTNTMNQGVLLAPSIDSKNNEIVDVQSMIDNLNNSSDGILLSDVCDTDFYQQYSISTVSQPKQKQQQEQRSKKQVVFAVNGKENETVVEYYWCCYLCNRPKIKSRHWNNHLNGTHHQTKLKSVHELQQLLSNQHLSPKPQVVDEFLVDINQDQNSEIRSQNKDYVQQENLIGSEDPSNKSSSDHELYRYITLHKMFSLSPTPSLALATSLSATTTFEDDDEQEEDKKTKMDPKQKNSSSKLAETAMCWAKWSCTLCCKVNDNRGRSRSRHTHDGKKLSTTSTATYPTLVFVTGDVKRHCTGKNHRVNKQDQDVFDNFQTDPKYKYINVVDDDLVLQELNETSLPRRNSTFGSMHRYNCGLCSIANMTFKGTVAHCSGKVHINNMASQNKYQQEEAQTEFNAASATSSTKLEKVVVVEAESLQQKQQVVSSDEVINTGDEIESEEMVSRNNQQHEQPPVLVPSDEVINPDDGTEPEEMASSNNHQQEQQPVLVPSDEVVNTDDGVESQEMVSSSNHQQEQQPVLVPSDEVVNTDYGIESDELVNSKNQEETMKVNDSTADEIDTVNLSESLPAEPEDEVMEHSQTTNGKLLNGDYSQLDVPTKNEELPIEEKQLNPFDEDKPKEMEHLVQEAMVAVDAPANVPYIGTIDDSDFIKAGNNVLSNDVHNACKTTEVALEQTTIDISSSSIPLGISTTVETKRDVEKSTTASIINSLQKDVYSKTDTDVLEKPEVEAVPLEDDNLMLTSIKADINDVRDVKVEEKEILMNPENDTMIPTPKTSNSKTDTGIGCLARFPICWSFLQPKKSMLENTEKQNN